MPLKNLQTIETTLLQLYAVVKDAKKKAEEERDLLAAQAKESHLKLGYALSLYTVGEEYFTPFFMRNKPIKAQLDDVHVNPEGYSYTLLFSYLKKYRHGSYRENLRVAADDLQKFAELNPGRTGAPLSDSELAAARLAFKQSAAACDRQKAKINEFKDPLATIELLLGQAQKYICELLFPISKLATVMLPKNSFNAAAGEFHGWIRDSNGKKTMIDIVSDEFPGYHTHVAFNFHDVLMENRKIAMDIKPLQEEANEWITVLLHDTYAEGLMKKYGIPYPVIKSKYLLAA